MSSASNRPPKRSAARVIEPERGAPLEPIRVVERVLTRPDGTKVRVEVPVYPPFQLRKAPSAPVGSLVDGVVGLGQGDSLGLAVGERSFLSERPGTVASAERVSSTDAERGEKEARPLPKLTDLRERRPR